VDTGGPEAAPEHAVRVAVCDDSLGFPALVRAWLSADDRLEHVGTAEDGEGIKRLVPAARPDVIVLDLVLPDVTDPVALVADLRGLQPGVRIVLVSSLLAGELERAAAAAGVEAFANKATTGPALCDLLSRVARDPRRPAAG
jgi:two-component system response regulator DesR